MRAKSFLMSPRIGNDVAIFFNKLFLWKKNEKNENIEYVIWITYHMTQMFVKQIKDLIKIKWHNWYANKSKYVTNKLKWKW